MVLGKKNTVNEDDSDGYPSFLKSISYTNKSLDQELVKCLYENLNSSQIVKLKKKSACVREFLPDYIATQVDINIWQKNFTKTRISFFHFVEDQNAIVRFLKLIFVLQYSPKIQSIIKIDKKCQHQDTSY